MSIVLNATEKHYLLSTIRNINDFPKPGIAFKDITTLLNNPQAYHMLIEHLKARYLDYNLDYIAAIESRGFLLGAPLAYALNIGFIPLRKPNKLPFTTVSEKYALEYGFDQIEIHIDALANTANQPARVLLIDDLIATGGTATAAVNLINKIGGHCVEACFLINLIALKGDRLIRDTTEVYSLLEIN